MQNPKYSFALQKRSRFEPSKTVAFFGSTFTKSKELAWAKPEVIPEFWTFFPEFWDSFLGPSGNLFGEAKFVVSDFGITLT